MTTENEPKAGNKLSMDDNSVMATEQDESTMDSSPQDVAKKADDECKDITIEMIDLLENEAFDPDQDDQVLVEIKEQPKKTQVVERSSGKRELTEDEQRGI